MITIDRITLREIRLALKEPFRISSGVMQERRIALLELTDRDGASAWSECVAFQLPIYTAETIDTAWLALREWLAPRVLGRELTGPAEVHGPGAMLTLEEGEEVTLYADAPARVMLLGGAKLDGERHIWWNFVSSSKDRIERAKQDWKEGKFGLIPGDDKEFIPLPEPK